MSRPKPIKQLLRHKLLACLILVVIGLLAFWLWPNRSPQANRPENTRPKSSSKPSVSSFNKTKYPTDQAASLWVVVNKDRQLPASYEPSDFGPHGLRVEADTAISSLFAAARQAGLELKITSGYRSYADQKAVYGGYVQQFGVAKTDSFSARPGHSEHQTGLAADVEPASGNCRLDPCFGQTPEGRWLAAHAYQFGFIIRYKLSQQDLTGYTYEPWHIRYVGDDLAAQLRASGQTMEQFFGLHPHRLNDPYPQHPYELKP